MALRFSKVTPITANTTDTAPFTFLVGGAPKTHSHFFCWSQYRFYRYTQEPGTLLTFHVEVYLYGDGDSVNAGPCEVAYLNERIVMRPDFLEARCRKVAQYNVDIFA